MNGTACQGASTGHAGKKAQHLRACVVLSEDSGAQYPCVWLTSERN